MWPRLGRQVLDAELARPAKEVKKRGAGKEGGQGEAATPEEVAEVRRMALVPSLCASRKMPVSWHAACTVLRPCAVV